MKKSNNKLLSICLLGVGAVTAFGFSSKNNNIVGASGYIGKNSQNLVEITAKCEKKTENCPISVKAKGAYIMESGTKTEIFSQDAEKRLPIASMCKMMTLLLCFDEIDAGKLALDEKIIVSEHAASMGGSQVFLDANSEYLVDNLMKSIVVCSANDSCVALAERICGSETEFVDKMNEKAEKLGMNNTLFANCTGLPKDPQYSCAKDVAIMLSALVKHEKYLEYSKIWMEDFAHPSGRVTGMTNTNKLVRFYQGCDGGKTGFTSQAGFCLAATAKRGEMRVISVVIGEESSDNRFNDVRSMFDYAFNAYTLKAVVDANAPIAEDVEVICGKKKCVSVLAERPVYVFAKRNEKANVTFETVLEKAIKAPVKKGEKVGEITIFKDNVEVDKVALIAAESIEKASVFDKFKDVADGWNF